MSIAPLDRRRAALLVARAGVVLCAAMVAVTGVGLWSGGVDLAGAAPNLAGLARIVEACDNPSGCPAIDSGGSDTPFTLSLFQGTSGVAAACPGDSANAGWRITSFMVPDSVDPATLRFDPVQGPEPNGTGVDFRQPLYETGSGTPLVQGQTADATDPGGPGPITNVPTFDFASTFSSGHIPPGTYTLGIACILGAAGPDQLDRFWTAEMEVTADAGDPIGIAWAAVAQDPITTTSTTGGATTSTSAGASTTSTSAGATTSTSAGGSTTSTSTGSSTSTTAGAGTTDGTSSGGPSSSSLGSSLPATGSSPAALVMWAFLLLVCGRFAVLLSRPPKVPTG